MIRFDSRAGQQGQEQEMERQGDMAPVLWVALCGAVCRNLGSLTALCPFTSLATISWGVGGWGGNKLMLLSSQQAMGIKTHIVPF